MSQFFSDYWKILKLDGQSMKRIGDDKSGLGISLKLFFLVAAIITLGGLVSSLSSGPGGFGSRLDNLDAKLNQILGRRLPPSLENAITQLSDRVNEATAKLDQFQPPLGKNASYIIRSIGNWLSELFLLLSRWMIACMAIFLVAKLFKGGGDLREHVSVLLLGIAPCILLVFSSFSFVHFSLAAVGTLLSLAAVVWSVLIIIKGLRLVHDFSTGKAVLVLLTSFLVFVVLLPAIAFSISLIGIFSLF